MIKKYIHHRVTENPEISIQSLNLVLAEAPKLILELKKMYKESIPESPDVLVRIRCFK